jgi:hypothetical protein
LSKPKLIKSCRAEEEEEGGYLYCAVALKGWDLNAGKGESSLKM